MRKYIGQVNSDNFIYPNNTLAEYDVEIIHDINNNSVSGTTTGFSALYNGGTGNIGISFTYIWNKNNAEPFIDDNNQLHVLSVHMSDPTKKYYKPWRMISGVTSSNISATTVTDTFLIIVTPAMMGLSYFTAGTYDFEIRFIGKRAIYPICQTTTVVVPTPTPTPGPTATPGGPTPTPTPTATPSNPCYCFPIVVTGTTGGEGGGIANLVYNDCYGVQTGRIFTVGPGTYYQCIQVISSVVQYDPILTTGIDQSYLTLTYLTGNCGTGYVCSGYDPATTPTPTPTPTATSVGPTNTPTPTPTGVPPTDTPTPTPTATSVGPTNTPTPTPTATDIPPTYTYLVNCSGTLQGYCLGELTAGQEVTIGGICYVATTTTTSPTGTLISGTQTLGACCPTPTPTPSPVPEGVGIYTGNTYGSSTTACNAVAYPSATVYIANGDTLSNGDVLYTDPGLTTPFNGNDNYYRLNFSGFKAATINGSGYVSNLTDCSSIPTPTPTPTGAPPTNTPTPTPTSVGYDYYLADKYQCLNPGCSYIESDVPVAFPSGYSYIGTHYYQPIGPDGYVYKITSSSTYAVSIILSTDFHNSNCSTACSIS